MHFANNIKFNLRNFSRNACGAPWFALTVPLRPDFVIATHGPASDVLSSNWLLAMLIGRAQRLAGKCPEDDPELMADAAIDLGQSELFRLENPKPTAFQLRFPGFYPPHRTR
jgi:hypothetical protein